jgi:hypothetical protein
MIILTKRVPDSWRYMRTDLHGKQGGYDMDVGENGRYKAESRFGALREYFRLRYRRLNGGKK